MTDWLDNEAGRLTDRQAGELTRLAGYTNSRVRYVHNNVGAYLNKL